MRIALVHDFLNQFGGAERVVLALHQLYRSAPLFTSIYDQGRLPEVFCQIDIRTSFMQQLPLVSALFKWYLLLYPLAFESFDLSEYEVILSSSSTFAKGVKKRPEQLHICYCHNPLRFVWRYDDYLKQEPYAPLLRIILTLLIEPFKQWDLQSNRSVDYFIANSRAVAERIRLYYGRESVIINPPVDTDFFQPGKVDGDYFLVVSRLNSYKRIDLAVEACSRYDLPLKVIGSGPMLGELRRLAKGNVEFLGRQSDAEIARRLAECRALILPGEEDFGITPLEAMACGRPVIAYRAGGALETVVEGETGFFFDQQTPQALGEVLRDLRFMSFNKEQVRRRALQFDRTVFQKKIKEFVDEKYRKKFGG